MKKKLLLTVLCLTIALVLSGCRQLDVIGNGSVTSFEEILDATGAVADDQNGGWSLTAPDGGTSFIWSRDFSKSADYDAAVEFDAEPFIKAGLDPDRLPDGFISDGKILVGSKYGTESPDYAGAVTPLSSYEQILRLKPEKIGYHDALDHYMLHIGNGNMIEFARDMSANDKDIVFIVNPQPLIDAGVDPNAVDGWVFTKIGMMDAQGKMTEADKFLKIFDLK